MKKDIWFKKLKAGLLCTVALFLAVLELAACGNRMDPSGKLTAEELRDLATMTSDAFFFGNVGLAEYGTEVFTHNLGLTVYKLDKPVSDVKTLEIVLGALTERGEAYVPAEIYLYLDPAGFSNKEEEIYRTRITEFAGAHPQKEITVLLSPMELREWAKKSDEEGEMLLSSCLEWVEAIAPFENGRVFYPGAEKWVIANPGNYEGDRLNAEVADMILAMTFADGHYPVDRNNAEGYLEILRQEIKAERENPAVYPDLSDFDIVFFGDSIIGNYQGSASIPGVVGGISGARVINLGEGGAPAQGRSDNPRCFAGELKAFLEGDVDDHNGRKIAFVINYGLNDYFGGGAVEDQQDPLNVLTYAGALRTGIRQIRAVYPQAVILVNTPNLVMMFQHGEEILGEMGGTLVEYVNATQKVAAEEDVLCLDNYSELGITPENEDLILADGVHFNPMGRFIVGERIAYAIGAYVQ